MSRAFWTRRRLLGASAGSVLMLAMGGSSAWAAAPAGAPSPTDPEFAEYLLRRIDNLHRGDSSHGTLTMFVKNERWERSMTLEVWSLGEDYSLIRILEPKKERGSATLKAQRDLFTYLSKTGRTIKISGASMGGSWMGSHFTNDDLVRETRLDRDFDHVVKDGPLIDGQPTWAVILTPKRNVPVVWGRIDVMVRKSDFLPAGQLFYTEDLKPIRKMEFFDVKTMGGREIATRLRMTPLDKAGEYTEIRYSKLEFGIDVDPSFFSVSQLKTL